jgi:hypothetical protein
MKSIKYSSVILAISATACGLADPGAPEGQEPTATAVSAFEAQQVEDPPPVNVCAFESEIERDRSVGSETQTRAFGNDINVDGKVECSSSTTARTLPECQLDEDFKIVPGTVVDVDCSFETTCTRNYQIKTTLGFFLQPTFTLAGGSQVSWG